MRWFRSSRRRRTSSLRLSRSVPWPRDRRRQVVRLFDAGRASGGVGSAIAFGCCAARRASLGAARQQARRAAIAPCDGRAREHEPARDGGPALGVDRTRDQSTDHRYRTEGECSLALACGRQARPGSHSGFAERYRRRRSACRRHHQQRSCDVQKGHERKSHGNLNNLINTVLVLLRVDLQKDGVRVEARLDEGLPAVEGDAVQLQQVILNLIVNAADAMSAVQPRVLTVQTSRIAGRAHISIEDTGPGMAKSTATASSTPCSRPRRGAWEWGFRSVARSSRTTAAASGSRPWKARVRSFNSNCPPPKPGLKPGPGGVSGLVSQGYLRQHDPEDGSARIGGGKGQLAFVALHDHSADREPQSHSPWLR